MSNQIDGDVDNSPSKVHQISDTRSGKGSNKPTLQGVLATNEPEI